jgi:hypothetical protein
VRLKEAPGGRKGGRRREGKVWWGERRWRGEGWVRKEMKRWKGAEGQEMAPLIRERLSDCAPLSHPPAHHPVQELCCVVEKVHQPLRQLLAPTHPQISLFTLPSIYLSFYRSHLHTILYMNSVV